MKLKIRFVALATCVLCTTVWAANDNFNRTSLGPDWAVTADQGFVFTSGDKLRFLSVCDGCPPDDFSNGVLLFGRASFLPAVTVGVRGGFLLAPQYGGITFGDLTGDNYALVALRASVFNFTDLTFRIGNNVAAKPLRSIKLTGIPRSKLIRMTVSMDGTVATVDIDTNRDGISEKTYSYDFGAPFVGVGLSADDNIALDNLATGTDAQAPAR
jgi:hypothetical protein